MTLIAASIGEWIFWVFAIVFTLIMVVGLIGFVANMFRSSRPDRRRR